VASEKAPEEALDDGSVDIPVEEPLQGTDPENLGDNMHVDGDTDEEYAPPEVSGTVTMPP
jgi:hypothetical protein